jgi:hypothetical protein
MIGNETDAPQGPFEGSRCLAGPAGHWAPATIRRVNEDGTFKIEFDDKGELEALLPYWYGVTPAEVSFDDARQWPPVFARISPDGRSLGLTDFRNAFEPLGFPVYSDEARQLWDQGWQTLFNVPAGKAEGLVLDASETYRLFRHLGLSAKLCADNLRTDRPKTHFKLYWNHLRMGGREPSELSRRVTLEDALAALGLTSARTDKSAVASLERFEQEQGVQLPITLVEFFRRSGVEEAVREGHPNNPYLTELRYGRWKLRRDLRKQNLSGDYAIVIMTPHQGDHEWAVVFDSSKEDAPVYLRWGTEEGEAWQLTAPGVGLFFWDLAQTGLAWYRDNQPKKIKHASRSDIGLVLDW